MFFSECEIIENLSEKNIFIIWKKPGVFRLHPLETLFLKRGGVSDDSIDARSVHKRLRVFT
jgi:hypothetical protein